MTLHPTEWAVPAILLSKPTLAIGPDQRARFEGTCRDRHRQRRRQQQCCYRDHQRALYLYRRVQVTFCADAESAGGAGQGGGWRRSVRVAMVCLGLAAHPVLELLQLFALTFAKSAGFVLDFAPKVVDLVVKALPSGLSAYTNRPSDRLPRGAGCHRFCH